MSAMFGTATSQQTLPGLAPGLAPVIQMGEARGDRAMATCHDCGSSMNRTGIFCDPCIDADDMKRM